MASLDVRKSVEATFTAFETCIDTELFTEADHEEGKG